ncbi:DUF924 domain-containing protein [Gammaproteobacteria bacterium]|nr:DUF924 domain-containing protein [Gammaproteobacteria bacterium]
MTTHQDVIQFWFEDIEQKLWYSKSDEFDTTLRQRFGALLDGAVQGELWQWRGEAEGRLAEIIVLDQFSRNIHRDTVRAFAADPMALALSQEAVAHGIHEQLDGPKASFLLMPYMHSESVTIHEQAVKLFDRPGLELNLEFEHKHKAIIDQFGRYPHRNAILGRRSSPEEEAFLDQPGSSF